MAIFVTFRITIDKEVADQDEVDRDHWWYEDQENCARWISTEGVSVFQSIRGRGRRAIVVCVCTVCEVHWWL